MDKNQDRAHTAKTEYEETASPIPLWQSVLINVKSSPFLLWQASPYTISGLLIFSFANSRSSSTESWTVWCSLLVDIVSGIRPRYLRDLHQIRAQQAPLILHSRSWPKAILKSDKKCTNKTSKQRGSTFESIAYDKRNVYASYSSDKAERECKT